MNAKNLSRLSDDMLNGLDFGARYAICTYGTMAADARTRAEFAAIMKRLKCINCQEAHLDPTGDVDAARNAMCSKCWEEAALENEHCDGEHDTYVEGCPMCEEELKASMEQDEEQARKALQTALEDLVRCTNSHGDMMPSDMKYYAQKGREALDAANGK